MKSLISPGRADPYDDSDDYEVVNLSDKGVTFRTLENELVWMSLDGMIEGILIPGEEELLASNDSEQEDSVYYL